MFQAIIYIVCFAITLVAATTYVIVNCQTTDISIELQQSNPFAKSDKWKHIAHYLTLLTLGLYTIFCLNSSLNELAYSGVNLSSFLSCSTLGKLSLSLYHTSNFTLYFVLISYWQHLYYGSEYYTSSTKKLHILIWNLMLLQWGYALYFDIAFVESQENMDDNTYKNCDDINIHEFPVSFGTVQVAIDIVLCSLFLIIFYKPFRSVLHYGAFAAATFDQHTVMLIPKLFNLVFWIILSHVVVMSLSIWLNMLWLIIFEVVVNGLVLILMAIPFHGCYEKMCDCYTRRVKQQLFTKSMIGMHMHVKELEDSPIAFSIDNGDIELDNDPDRIHLISS
eukprot:129104_1